MEAARARRPQDLLLSSRTSRAGRRGLASGSTTSSQRSRLLLRTVGGSTLFGRCPTVRDWRESTWGEATLFGKASLRLLALLEASGGSVSTPSGQHCGSTNKKRRSIAFRGQPACTLGDVGSPRTSQLPQLPRHPRLHRQRRQLLQLPQQLQPHRQVLRQLPQVPRHPRLHRQRRQLLQLPQQLHRQVLRQLPQLPRQLPQQLQRQVLQHQKQRRQLLGLLQQHQKQRRQLLRLLQQHPNQRRQLLSHLGSHMHSGVERREPSVSGSSAPCRWSSVPTR